MLAPRQRGAKKTFAQDDMSQTSIFGFPIPVLVAAGLVVLMLLMLARALAGMRKPFPAGALARPSAERFDDAGRDDEHPFRLGRLEIAPLGEHGRRDR
jgi:hypothetical protein